MKPIPEPANLNLVFAGNFPFPLGDAGAQLVAHHAAYFAARGASVGLLILRGLPVLPGNESLAGESKGVPYRVIGRRMSGLAGTLAHALGYTREGIAFLRSRYDARRLNALVVYGEPDPENVVFLRAARRIGYVVASWVAEDLAAQAEDATFRYRVKRRVTIAMRRWMPTLVDGVAVLTTRLADRFRPFGLPVAVIPVAAEFAPAPPPAELHRPLRLLYAGSFARKDGVETLLDAFGMVRDEAGGCVLSLVGACQEAAERRLAPRGLAGPGVRRTGYVSDEAFSREIAEADVLCMTRVNTAYANAGFPYKLVSYLASARPVIATKVSDIPLYLQNERDALLVPPEQPRAVADAIRFLRDHPDRARAIGLEGRRVFERCFTTDATGPQWLSFIAICRDWASRRKQR